MYQADYHAKLRKNQPEYKKKYRSKPEAVQKWREENPERVENSRLKYRYGIDLAAYNALLEAQGGVCAACGEPERRVRNGQLVKLGVDHDHACCPGRKACGNCVRGLLCCRCNSALGLVGDDSDLLAKLADYLKILERTH